MQLQGGLPALINFKLDFLKGSFTIQPNQYVNIIIINALFKNQVTGKTVETILVDRNVFLQLFTSIVSNQDFNLHCNQGRKISGEYFANRNKKGW